MKNFVIIVAGGTGTRMGADCPKQFLEIKGKPILMHTLQKFLTAQVQPQLHLIVVVHPHFVAYTQDLLEKYLSQQEQSRIQLTTGGDTRYQSVQKGLNLIENANLVAEHDAVRPLLSTNLIEKVFETAQNQQSAVPVIALTDSVRQYTCAQKTESKALNRDFLVQVQTPQCFLFSMLKKGYQQNPQAHFTDSASVVESLGFSIHLVEGETNNIKITRPIDLVIAENL